MNRKPKTRRPQLPAIALLITATPAAALQFDVEFIDNAEGDFAVRGWLDSNSDFQRNVVAAALEWAKHIDSDVTIEVSVSADRTIARAGGTFNLGAQVGTDPDGRTVFEPAPLTAARTGSMPGGGPEILLTFNSQFVDDNYWLDPTPEDQSDPAPIGSIDLVSIAMHELGHGLGIAGFRDFSPGNFGEYFGNTITNFDELTFYDGNGEPRDGGGELNDMFFAGALASALFGGPLTLALVESSDPLFSQNFYHFGVCDDPPIARESLMTGCFTPNDGSRLSITPLDVAVLEDLGYPIALADPVFANGFEVETP